MRLVADRGAQQAAEYLLRAAPALRRVEHVARDRHVDAVVPREGDDGRGAFHPFGDHVHVRDDIADGPPPSEYDPDVALAPHGPGTVRHQLAPNGEARDGDTAAPTPAPTPRDTRTTRPTTTHARQPA